MTPADWPEVRTIYEEGIADRLATFETEVPGWAQWDRTHLPACRLMARGPGEALGWAALSPVSGRACYAGVAEASVYVRRSARGRGVGRALLERLLAASDAAGIWTLQGSTFPENVASLRLQLACGFRVVGRRERIAQLDGLWRDTVLTERRSPAAGPGTEGARAAAQIEMYAIPSFALLATSDLARSSAWYQDALGFQDVFTFRMADGRPVLAHLRWRSYAELLLTPERAPASHPRGAGVTLCFTMPDHDPLVDGLAERARAHGATIAAGPADTPWNTRDVTILDPDGYRLTFTGAQRGLDGRPTRGTGSFRDLAALLRSPPRRSGEGARG
jgi:L-amino acid N-acyltransferase YncA/catechol 2,3-dioxygenase-like lactoylglutathione lyase family enzyme